MAKKCYAVRKGHKTGLFFTWDDCQSAVKGFKGAEFKGFNTDEEAFNWLNGVDTPSESFKLVVDRPSSDDVMNIYCDGSYQDGLVSFGLHLESSERDFNFYGVVDAGRFSSINNIAGELLAVLAGVQLANDMGFKRLNIIYDYAGIERWYKGDWTAKGELQNLYVTLMNQFRISYGVAYRFVKVKGHSGVDGNVMADKMAKRAIKFKSYVDMNAILRGILTVSDVHTYR